MKQANYHKEISRDSVQIAIKSPGTGIGSQSCIKIIELESNGEIKKVLLKQVSKKNLFSQVTPECPTKGVQCS